MRRINTESLQKGMTVPLDVHNMDGILLLPSGCELSAWQIEILQAWGAAEINVESTQSEAADADPLARLEPEEVAKTTAELKALFWQADEADPVFTETFRLMLFRQVRRGEVEA